MTGDGDSEKRDVWRTKFPQRICAIVEIVIGGWILTLLAGLFGLLGGFLWKAFNSEEGLNLTVVLATAGVSLIPVLVVIAKVWEVNLSLFGNRAQAERIPTAYELRELPGQRVSEE